MANEYCQEQKWIGKSSSKISPVEKNKGEKRAGKERDYKNNEHRYSGRYVLQLNLLYINKKDLRVTVGASGRDDFL